MNEDKDKVLAAIHPGRLRKIFMDLLSIYSPSGKEHDVQLYLEERLVYAGFFVEHQTVEDGRYNLHVTMGSESPKLYLVAHVDTVPAWDRESLEPQEEDDIVRGLGSADMKGGCAAMLEAWLAMAEALPFERRPPVGLLLAVGEETNGDGSAAFLAAKPAPPWVVIGEPTGLSACFAHYGYLEANLVASGRRSHASLPELGHNAVESMLRALLHFWNDDAFGSDKSGIVHSIREMSSSRAGFVVPDRCEACLDLHLPPDKTPEEAQAAVLRIAAEAKRAIPDLDLRIDFDFASPGYDLGIDNPLAQTLSAIYRELDLPLRLDAFRSHSDGNLFYAAGAKPVILGPGALEAAHTPDEQAAFSEVLAAAHIYAALCLEADGLVRT